MTQQAPPRLIWWNGKIVPYQSVIFGFLNHASNYGTSVFEGIRAYWNETHQELYVFRMPAHYARMVSNARKFFRCRIPWTVDELCEATMMLLRKEGYRENVYVRPRILVTDEMIGVGPEKFKLGAGIVAVPLGEYLPGAGKGLRMTVSSFRRLRDTMIPPSGKIGGAYANSFSAKRQAHERGAQEAILLTEDGFVSEGSGENIFLVYYGPLFERIGMLADVTLVTPPRSADILPGITRDAIMRIAASWNMTTIERNIMPSELLEADEVFLTGTACEVTAVTMLDRQKIGRGTRGPVTAHLAETFADIARRNVAADVFKKSIRALSERWTTPVYG